MNSWYLWYSYFLWMTENHVWTCERLILNVLCRSWGDKRLVRTLIRCLFVTKIPSFKYTFFKKKKMCKSTQNKYENKKDNRKTYRKLCKRTHEKILRQKTQENVRSRVYGENISTKAWEKTSCKRPKWNMRTR